MMHLRQGDAGAAGVDARGGNASQPARQAAVGEAGTGQAREALALVNQPHESRPPAPRVPTHTSGRARAARRPIAARGRDARPTPFALPIS